MISFIIMINLLCVYSRPNVIVVLFDDLGWGTLNQRTNLTNMLPGTIPNKLLLTPNLDRITPLGLQFKNAYAPSPLCSPSRLAMIRGMRTDRTYTRDNMNYDVAYDMTYDTAYDMAYPTIPSVFRDVGYKTIKIGKHGLGEKDTSSDPRNCGYQQFIGYYTNVNAHYVYPTSIAYNNSTMRFDNNRRASINTCLNNQCTYASDIFLEEFKKFYRNRDPSIPFYLEFNPTQPHVGKFIGSKMANLIPNYGIYTDMPWSNDHKGFAAQITYLDNMIGEIHREINGSDTLLIITSDNGGEYDIKARKPPTYFQQNGGLRMYKRYVYEGGTRVPFVAIWPNVIKPGVSRFPINLYDLRVTFEELVGNRVTNTVDGPISILGLLLGNNVPGNNVPKREYMSTEYCFNNLEINCKWAFYKTTGSFMKLMYDDNALGFRELQLYNLTADEGETHNLIKLPEYRMLIDIMYLHRNNSRLTLD